MYGSDFLVSSSLIFYSSITANIDCLTRYGGKLLARGEYNPLSFFVIYIAVVQGSEGVS